jgi:alanine racemase
VRSVRGAGFTGRVLRVRTASAVEIAEVLTLNVDEMVGNLEVAQAASQLALAAGTRVAVHVALNSGGMSRNGVEMTTPAGKAAALAIARLPGLTIVGIMSHFAVEEASDVRVGLARFAEESAWLVRAAGLERNRLLLHTANSFATLAVPESRLDLVRPGGALFGDTVPSHTEYRRVMQFKSRVAAVNRYPAGNTVGYDRSFTLARESLLANVAVGYADGYRRAFGNKAFVLIRGRRVPVVGNVSMNTLMVDVTDLPEAAAGDEVVLFGRQGGEEITQAELERANGALLADLYTVWGHANARVLRRRSANLEEGDGQRPPR